MRALEFLLEDYNQKLKNDLNNLLVASKGLDSSEIKTDELIDELQKLGYSSINNNNILELLSDNPIVLNATPEIIKVADKNSVSDTDDSAKKVKELARKAVKRKQKKEI